MIVRDSGLGKVWLAPTLLVYNTLSRSAPIRHLARQRDYAYRYAVRIVTQAYYGRASMNPDANLFRTYESCCNANRCLTAYAAIIAICWEV